MTPKKHPSRYQDNWSLEETDMAEVTLRLLNTGMRALMWKRLALGILNGPHILWAIFKTPGN